MRLINETKLIEGCLSGNKEAWSGFLEKFSKLIYWSIRERLKRCNVYFNEEDCEDIFQEIVMHLLKENRLAKVRNSKKVSAWLAMVSANKTLDYLRRNRSVKFIPPESPAFEELNTSPQNNVVDHRPNPRQRLEMSEVEKIFDTYIQGLSEREKQVLKLYYLYERKQREVAKALSLSLNHVSVMIKRAREKIGQRLRKKAELF